MKVKILFFGAAAEAVGKREIEFQPTESAQAKTVFTEVVDAFPNLKKNFGDSLLFSVNQEYADGSETIRDGDELAVFTAVSGG